MTVLCVDLKSFYASVECILRNLDPLTTPLVVADERRGKGSIVLAVTPKLRERGVSSRCRLYELPRDEDIIIARPRMRRYIEFSCKVYEIYLKYVAPEDIHVYSIDEAFIDLTHYIKYYNADPITIAEQILQEIYDKTGLTAAAGVGENMFLAKVALDCLAKNQKNSISYLNKHLFEKHIWDLEPIDKIWGIGKGNKRRLAKLKINNMRELAATPLKVLEREFGILGLELHNHAHGRDETTVQSARSYKSERQTLGYGQVLLEDYNYKDLMVIITETAAEIATELILKHLCCQEVSISIGYTKKIGGGFSKQLKLEQKTNSFKKILSAFINLYNQNIKDFPIRRINMRVGKLSLEDYIQSNLFSSISEEEKEQRLFRTIGEIRQRYGKKSVFLAVSNTSKGTYLKRSTLIGGHNAE